MDWSRIVEVAQVVGAVAAVIAIPLAIVLHRAARKRISLAYAFSSVIPIVQQLGAGIEGLKEIQILYGGQPVSRVFALAARVHNIGNIPLKRSHVHQPITLRFPDDTRILGAWITRTVPEHIEASLRLENGAVVLDCELMNPDDRVYIQFICDGVPGNPATCARIEGMNHLVEAEWETRIVKAARKSELVASIPLGLIFTGLYYFLSPVSPNFTIFHFSMIPIIFVINVSYCYVLVHLLVGLYLRITGRDHP